MNRKSGVWGPESGVRIWKVRSDSRFQTLDSGLQTPDFPELMFTRDLKATLELAANEASHRRHEFLTLEHLLFAMLKDKRGSDVIYHCGGDLELLGGGVGGVFN